MSNPTMRRRQLANEMRRLRRQAGMTMQDVAAQLSWDESRISKIETRVRGLKVVEVHQLLGVYGVTDSDVRDRLTDMARRAKERAWWQTSYGRDVIPSEYGELIDVESEAHLISTYQSELVPGLLQTREYARAVIEAARPDDTPEQITERVSARLSRQRILSRTDPPPPRIRAILNEAVLRRKVGGAEVMRGQLRHLIDGPADIRILPFSAGAHPAMAGMPFAIHDFDDADDLAVVSSETSTGMLFLESDDDLTWYAKIFRRLSDAALDAERSRAILITQVEG